MDRVVTGSSWTRWTTWGSRSSVSWVKKPCSAPFRQLHAPVPGLPVPVGEEERVVQVAGK